MKKKTWQDKIQSRKTIIEDNPSACAAKEAVLESILYDILLENLDDLTRRLMTNTQNHPRTSQLVNCIRKQNIECVLTTSAGSRSNLQINTSQYLLKDALPCTILVLYLEIDLPKKFNLNLGYILIWDLDPDNQDVVFYKVSFIKLMNML